MTVRFPINWNMKRSAEEINSLYPTFLTRFENPADLSLQLGIPVFALHSDRLLVQSK